MDKYLPTGNEMLSIPRLAETGGAVEDVTFLYMGCKGLIDLRGAQDEALMAPFVEVNGTALPLKDLCWERLGFWVPRFHCKAGPLEVEGTLLAPTGERGFGYRLALRSAGEACGARFGLAGCWAGAWHCVNEEKPIEGRRGCFHSLWNDGPVFDMTCGTPLFAFAPMSDAPCRCDFEQEEKGVRYRLVHEADLAPGESCAATVWWGFGYEEVSAATSAKEMLRQGWQTELDRTLAWLARRSADLGDEALTRWYNTNLFFCIHFSTGVTLDTEELVLVTSRSPRYYVSAAYWDRDSLLWSFPAILQADPTLARRMLDHVFGRQRRNLGVHSRFIDGTVLEPGFELDELMAPVLALERYVAATGDRAVLQKENVRQGVEEILEKLTARRHPQTALYETFLQPTDDERVHPYLTYDNALVWRALRALARLFPERAALAEEAEAVRQAVREHCVKTNRDGAPYFAWSVDLAGNSDVYDEPPGSLQLLAELGFCEKDDPVWQNTVAMIRAPEYRYSFAGCPIAEIGCPHAPHPWLLSVANSLLCGRVEQSLAILRASPMDNGIACESIDEVTGECTTGEAFATCAGFVCYALRRALKGGEEDA